MRCIERLNENEMNVRQKSWLGEVFLATATRRRRCHCHAGCCGYFSTTIPVVSKQIRASSSSSDSFSPFSERQKRSLVMKSPSGSFVLLLLLLLLLSGLATSQDEPQETSVPSLRINQTTAPATAAVVTLEPSFQPTILVSPTSLPTRPATFPPSDLPSAPPSISLVPTISPAPSISSQPSGAPSLTMQPSSLPSSALPRQTLGRYRQNFVIEQNITTFFNDTEKAELASLFESYTDEFAVDDPELITTRCMVNEQKIFTDPGGDGQAPRQILTMDYRCSYISSFVQTDEYPALFVDFVNTDLPNVTIDVQNISSDVIEALTVFLTVADSPAPTFSMIPSSVPSFAPTFSAMPSSMPSDVPTNVPTPERFPTLQPSVSSQPTSYPTGTPMALPPTDDGPSVGLIAGLVIALGLAGLGGLFVFYRRSKQNRATRVTGTGGANSGSIREPSSVIRPTRTGVDYGGDIRTDAGVVILPSDSLASNKSFLSAGDDGIGDDSGDEADGTKNLQDEFDQYKDQTLEQFRSNIEGNLTGFEGIMSAAVTKALMGDDDDNVDQRELLWGCEPGANGAEIEASALCEVSDWIKRNETAPSERKRVFMKEVLNRMVTSVRLGVMHANDGSRTIHECAALLGLPLKHELPMTTVIISGMRKTVGANEMMKVLREFGEIDVCAVASGQRGFGIVRFRNTKSVDRAMRRYRGGEIVVQDVAIQMKVLNPSGVVDS